MGGSGGRRSFGSRGGHLRQLPKRAARAASVDYRPHVPERLSAPTESSRGMRTSKRKEVGQSVTETEKRRFGWGTQFLGALESSPGRFLSAVQLHFQRPALPSPTSCRQGESRGISPRRKSRICLLLSACCFSPVSSGPKRRESCKEGRHMSCAPRPAAAQLANEESNSLSELLDPHSRC